MATGTVIYWNGSSGWIKQTKVEHLSTAETGDVMLMERFVDSGTIVLGAAVTFTIAEDGTARNVTVDTRGDGDKPPPVDPLPEDSPPDVLSSWAG
jgi:hypothetical protein